MGKWKDALNAGRDDVGVNDASLSKRLDALEAQAEGDSGTGGGGTSIPEPCTPNFVLTYEKFKKRVRARMCANVAPGTPRLITVIVRTQDRTDATTFERGKIKAGYELEEAQVTSGHVEYLFPVSLEWGMQYDLVRLITEDGSGGRQLDPPPDPVTGSGPVFNTPPLAQFTTPQQFGSPGAPNAADILLNELDPTTKEYDARVLVRLHAPTDQGNQSFGAYLVEEVVVVFTRDGRKIKFGHLLTSDEQSQVDGSGRGFVDVMCSGLAPGATYIWTQNICWTNGEKSAANGAVSFIAGGGQIDPANLTGVTLTVSALEPFDGRRVQANLTAVQPSTVVFLKNIKLFIRRTNQTDADYVPISDNYIASLRDDSNHVPLTAITPVKWDVPTRPTKSYRLRAVIKAMGGLTRTVDSTDFVPGDVALATRNYQFSDVNMVFNGGFLLSRADTAGGAATDLADRWQIGEGPVGAHPRINTTPTGGLSWDNTNHRLRIAGASGFEPTPVVKIKKQILPGETYALTFLIKADSAYNMGFMTTALTDRNNADTITLSIIQVAITSPGDGTGGPLFNFNITTQYAMWGAIFQVPTTYIPSDGSQWLQFHFYSPNVTVNTYIDNVMLVRNQTMLPWSPSPSEVDFDYSITPPDTGAGAVGGIGGGKNLIYGDSSITGTEISIPSGRLSGQLIAPGIL